MPRIPGGYHPREAEIARNLRAGGRRRGWYGGAPTVRPTRPPRPDGRRPPAGAAQDRPWTVTVARERRPSQVPRVVRQETVQGVPSRVNAAGSGFEPVWVPLKPKLVDAPGASLPL